MASSTKAAPSTETGADAPALELRLLGPLEVRRNGERVALPRSKKARALLGYLATSGREHNRERLCGLLWDVTDDPRGALRWSLSKLRRVVDDDDAERITADRHAVRFDARGARIDVLELLAATRDGGGAALSLEQLEALAAAAQGELLEGLELPDFLEFQAWLLDARERAREARCQVLAELTSRLRDQPRLALRHAHARVSADPLSVPARVELMATLLKLARRDDAQQQLESGCRLFREIGAPGVAELQGAYRELCTAQGASAEAPPPPPAPVARHAPVVASHEPPSAPVDSAFVGRQAERERLGTLLEATRSGGTQRVALVTGDPGAGKSRLAEELKARARQAGTRVLTGRAFEAERSRPYGPWADALGGDLGGLPAEGDGRPGPGDREALFAAVADAVGRAAAGDAGALLVIDDVQWLDRDSAELLHYVVRTTRERSLGVLLLARSGELDDNEPARRALRGLRRETVLDTLELGPLGPAEIAELVGQEGDAAAIFEASGGNALYALELARAHAQGMEETPDTLVALVRERIERLPARAAEVLRWAAVLGHAVQVSRLQDLCSIQPLDLLEALDRLERHAVLRGDPEQPGARYVFAHDVVREAVYSELSQPRRRLMHQQVARTLRPHAADPEVATEVAHHASLGGDGQLGVGACVVAARRSLRLFANADAESLAKRGLALAADLPEADRVTATLELLQVQYAARTPDRQQAAERVAELAERALELGLSRTARLGFQVLSYLRWESSRMAEAHEHIMQAERISRSGDAGERSVALAQAAKCLLLLERDLDRAEAFALEACALAEHDGAQSSAAALATGMLHEHRGECQSARACFREARELGRQSGDRLAEFAALEHSLMLELDVGQSARALELAEQLAELGERVRAGAEGPSARGLLALAQRYAGQEGTGEALEAAIEELVIEDAKYELTFLLTRLAALELAAGEHAAAETHASRALALATDVGRSSEVAHARAVLARLAAATGAAAAAEEHRQALRELQGPGLSCGARKQVERALEA